MKAGDIVRIGNGKKLWTITEFDTWPDGRPYASLKPLQGYTNRTALVTHLTPVP